MKYSVLSGLAFLVSALFMSSAHSETLVQYDIGALSSWDGNGLNPPSWGVAANVDASPITVSSSDGYGHFEQGRWGGVKSNLWVERWPPASKMGAVYYEWTVSAEPGHVLNLDDVAVGVGNEYREDLDDGSWIELKYTGPRNFRLYSSIEGFGGEDYIASVKTPETGNGRRIVQERLYAELGDEYKNVSSVTFRVYGFFDEAQYNKINDKLISDNKAGAGLSKFATGVLFLGAGGGSYKPDGPNGNVVVRGSVGDGNRSGRLVAGPRHIAPVHLSTSVTSAENAVEVLEFTLVNEDKGSSAVLDVSQIKLKALRSFDAFYPGKITWRLNGPGSDGVIGVYDSGARAITFDVPDIVIDNGTEQTYTIDAHFNDITDLAEREAIKLEIRGRDAVVLADGGTRMLSGQMLETMVYVDVEATHFVFTAQPDDVVSGKMMMPAPAVQARDDFGNVDDDFDDWNSYSTTLGKGEGEGEVYPAYGFPIEGGAAYHGLYYFASQDNETFTLRMSATVNGRSVTGESDPITSDAVATRLRFVQQPVATEPVSGVDAAFTTVPIVQAIDAYRVVDTDYSGDITLSVQGSGATTLSASDDADSEADTVTISLTNGVAEFTGLTFNYATASTTDIRLLASTSGMDTVQSDTITVLAFNEPPGLNNIDDSSVTFVVGGDAVLLDDNSDSELSDPDNADFDGGKLTVAITDGGEPLEDLLTFRNDGDVALSGDQQDAEVSVDSVVIGTLGNDIAEGQDLVVNLNGDATPDRVRILVQSVLYDNSAASPTTGERTLEIRLDDGRDDVVVSMTVSVRPPPPAPPPAPPVVTVVSGETRNDTLSGNATITEQGVLNGGAIVGSVQNRGEVTGTVTMRGTGSISGGRVSGQVSGDAGSTARIDGAKVVSGARLENVMIGPETVLEPGVKLGANVRFESESSLPAGQELTASMGSIPWVNGDQRSVVNLRGDVVSGQSQGVLASIRQLDGFDTEGNRLEQDETTGELWLRGNGFSASVVPVSVSKAGPDMVPGTSIDEDGNVRIVTGTRVVIALPALEDKDGFGDFLARAGLALTGYDEHGNMVIENEDTGVTGSDTERQSNVLALTDVGETYNAGRPDLLSVPATRGDSPGVVEYVVPGMGGLIAFSVLFEDDNGNLMQQDIVPVPADWVALRTTIRALPGADNVRINEWGIITVELDGQEVRGLMAYTVVRGSATRDNTILIEQGDLTGNGATDFEVRYPDGRRQYLYLYP